MSSCAKNCASVSGGSLQECFNKPVEIHAVNKKHHVVGKIPVVLAELVVQINVHSTIKLPEEALEIKRVKKRLKITQCQLISTSHHDECNTSGKFKLFLEGFVRKNIEFSTLKCKNPFGVCGDIHHCTVDVPFSCVTPIWKFNGAHPLPIVFNESREYEFFKSSPLSPKFPEKDNLLSGDLSEFNECSFEYFNELPFCELVSSNICEQDETVKRHDIPDAPFEERTFKEFSEKMIIDVTLKVLQNQQVYVPKYHHHHHRSANDQDEVK